MAGRPKGRFRCGEQLQDGSVCGEVFTRAGNLQRHLRVQHQAEMPVRFRFVYMVPDGEGDLREEQDESCHEVPASLPAHGCVDLAATAREWTAAVGSIARHVESIAACSSNIASMVAADGTAVGRASKRKRQPSADVEDDGGAPPMSRDKGFRFGRAAYRSPMPQYLVKQSRASPSQQCALSWLSSRTKARVDKNVSQLMRSWGVGVEYEASCLLVPAKWKMRNPAQVLAQASFEECKTLESDRLELKADDHQTTFARAVAWFNDWGSPKRGIDLDNFLESGPFRRMVLLLIRALTPPPRNPNHLQYEPASVNQARMVCLDEARQMRRNNQGIPWGCSLHTPPCMLQLAVLTTFEAIQVQRSVFYRGAEELHEPRPPRPRQHRFPTFETRLPLSYAAPGAHAGPEQGAADGGIAGGGPGRLPKPDLCCPFCTTARRAFNSVVGLWAHIVHTHEEEGDAERAGAVRSSAGEWQEYWLARGSLPPASSPTVLKVTQALGPAFSWADVESWGLRP